jgi:Dolichyl-phosphate-mannose-protein mannosyltransferase
MNFGKCFSTAFARNPAQAEAFAQAVSTPPQGNSTFLKNAVSPDLDVTPRLAGPGTYSAAEWLNALTERLRRAAASRALVYAAFTVLYLVPTLWLASGKLIWDDEFFTLYLARAGWRSLLAALATGADQHPPPFYYITHWVFQLFGMSHITLRLPAIAGFWILCVCLYEIVRWLTVPMWGVVAMLFPLSTRIYYYASEGRGYGLVMGFAAMAVLAWFKATEPRRSAVFLPLLAVSLAGAVSSHYYAVLILISLAAGELVRTRALGRIDVPVWIAFAFTFLPLVVFLPTILSARQYSAHFWAVPVWSDAIYFYSRELGLGAVPLIGFLTAGLIFGFAMRGRMADMNFMRGGRPGDSLHERPRLTAWQATALYLLTATPVTAMLMAKYVTHGFSPRYAISSIVGIATLAAYLLSRAAPRALMAMAAAVLCLIMYGVEIRVLGVDFGEQRAHLIDSSRALSGSGDAQIALMDITVMHQLSFYATRELAARVNYVADPEKSIEYLKQDTVDHGLLDLRPWFPLKVVRVESFLADNPRFLAYGAADGWSWLTYDLPKWGETRLIERVDEHRMLFSIDHVRVPHPERLAEQRADPTPMLYTQMPKSGPSLCMLWMGPKNCPRLR